MKNMKKLIKAGLILAFFLIALAGFLSFNSTISNEDFEESEVVSQMSKQHDSQIEPSVSKQDQEIEIEFWLEPKFEQNPEK